METYSIQYMNYHHPRPFIADGESLTVYAVILITTDEIKFLLSV
jgi:hypothetical protein